MNVNDNHESAKSQNAMILAYLQEGHSITSYESLNLFGCMRLASRINDLRNKGYNIETTKVQTSTGKWVAQYTLKQD